MAEEVEVVVVDLTVAETGFGVAGSAGNLVALEGTGLLADHAAFAAEAFH